MRLLLDSHVLLWYDRQIRLSLSSIQTIEEAEAVFVSAATVWELTIKTSVAGNQVLNSSIEIANGHGFTLLSITPAHAKHAGSLPLHHRDPFDRMLVAQAMLEKLTLVTHDRTLSQYDVPLLLV